MIRFEAVSKSYGAVPVVDGVTLEVPAGRILVLLGESGSGKSTLLRMANRLVVPDSGRVLLDGRDVAGVAPEILRRGIGYVIQSVGLFPHWRVRDNVATVPRLLGWDGARVARRTDALLELVGLDPALFRDRWPHELSGGQAQRVGLARALAADPPVLLMDEPFSALDPATRLMLRGELRRIHAATGGTILFVTHDAEEALALADELAVLRLGRLAAHGRPAEVLRRDADAAVRGIFGDDTLAFHRLGALPAAAVVRGVESGEDLPALPEGATLKQALMLMLDRGTDRVRLGPRGGVLRMADLLDAA